MVAFALRWGAPSLFARKHEGFINKSLAKMPADPSMKKVPLYRWVGEGWSEGRIDSFLRGYQVGRVITMPEFISASLAKNHPKFSDRKVKFVIYSHSGRDVKDLSANPDEAEVLIRSGTRFKVLVIKHPTGQGVVEIHLEEV